MSCRVYLIRHGETVWNAKMRFQGHSDIPLTEVGEKQAQALSDRLAGEAFHAFYSSDLKRAYDTALLLSGPHNLNVHKIPNLREINFGKWEGLTFNGIIDKFGKEAAKWWDNPSATRIPGGENLQEVADRCFRAVKQIVQDHQGQQVVVVAHGGTIRCIISKVLGINLNQYWRLRLDNASVNIIDFPEYDKGVLALFNDTNHLNLGPIDPAF